MSLHVHVPIRNYFRVYLRDGLPGHSCDVHVSIGSRLRLSLQNLPPLCGSMEYNTAL
jgi:hypothetical protein